MQTLKVNVVLLFNSHEGDCFANTDNVLSDTKNWENYIGPTNNEWMMHLYSAVLCIVVHPKHFTIMCVCGGGGGGLYSTTSSGENKNI